MAMKQIKFANRWYKVHDTKFSLGVNWYKIEDEPNHFDWISENSVQGYRVIMPTYNVLICDCCGEQYETIDGYSSYIGDEDGSAILNDAESSDWREIQGKHYCEKCWKYEGDNIIVTKDGHKFDAETEEELQKKGEQNV